MADKNKQGEYYSRPAKLGKWEGFKQFLWNSETSELLGRTGGSWGKLKKISIEKKNLFLFSNISFDELRNIMERGKKHGGLFFSPSIHFSYSFNKKLKAIAIN